MSGSRRKVLVSRDYRPAPDECTRALEMLLRNSVKTAEGPAPEPNGLDGTTVKEDTASAPIIPK